MSIYQIHMNDEHLAVLHSMEDFVGESLNFLAPVGKAWQPNDYLPDMHGEGWYEELKAFRELAESVSDELLVVLVGDMVTEEALPSYSVQLNLIAHDGLGDAPRPWAKWLRGWTAE